MSLPKTILGLKKNREIDLLIELTEDNLSDYIETNLLLRYLVVTDKFERGCIESYLIALLRPKYSVPVLNK